LIDLLLLLLTRGPVGHYVRWSVCPLGIMFDGLYVHKVLCSVFVDNSKAYLTFLSRDALRANTINVTPLILSVCLSVCPSHSHSCAVYINTVSQKTYNLGITLAIVTDFKTFFTVGSTPPKNAARLLLYFPSHLKHVATLVCEIKASKIAKNVTYLTK